MKTVDFSEIIVACDLKVGRCRQLIKQANSENLCPPPRSFLRNMESSENVKFVGGFIHTRYILST